MGTKKVTISLTPEQQEKARFLSKDFQSNQIAINLKRL